MSEGFFIFLSAVSQVSQDDCDASVFFAKHDVSSKLKQKNEIDYDASK